MSNTFQAKSVVLLVIAVAIVGMILGGLFGLGAGLLAPEFFARLIPWRDIEPVGIAVIAGATCGVLLGGALGAFAISVQLFFYLLTQKDRKAQ